jgi:hypothetical protein
MKRLSRPNSALDVSAVRSGATAMHEAEEPELVHIFMCTFHVCMYICVYMCVCTQKVGLTNVLDVYVLDV